MALEDIKKNLKSEKLILGSDRSMKLLKLKKLSRVFISANTPKNILDDISYYGKLTETEVEKLKMPNDELGTYCKKPFPISVIGLLK